MTKSRYYPIFINGGGGGKDPVLTDITVTPTKEEQTFPTPEGFDGIANVTVEGYTPKTEPIEIVPRRWEIVIPVDTDLVDGWGTITVDAYTPVTETVTITPQRQAARYLPSPDVDGYREVTVQGVTSDIDQNIKPENIKKDVEILGVTGTLESGGGDNGFSLIFRSETRQDNIVFLRTDDLLVKRLRYKYTQTSNWVYPFGDSDEYVNVNTDVTQLYLMRGYSECYLECDGIKNIKNIAFIGCTAGCVVSGTTDVILLSKASQELIMQGDWSDVVYTKDYIPHDSYNTNNNMYLVKKGINFDNVKYIGPNGCNSTFRNNTKLTKAIIPRHLNTSDAMMYNMFNGCTNITEIEGEFYPTSESDNNIYYGMFEGCTKLLKCIDFPVTETLPANMFNRTYMRCKSITESPEIFQTKIGSTGTFSQTFYECTSLVKANPIHFTGNVSGGTSQMFYGCTALREMTWTATTPPTINSNMWTNCPADMVIYVPDESVDAYKAASVWSSRAAYIKGISEKPTE